MDERRWGEISNVQFIASSTRLTIGLRSWTRKRSEDSEQAVSGLSLINDSRLAPISSRNHHGNYQFNNRINGFSIQNHFNLKPFLSSLCRNYIWRTKQNKKSAFFSKEGKWLIQHKSATQFFSFDEKQRELWRLFRRDISRWQVNWRPQLLAWAFVRRMLAKWKGESRVAGFSVWWWFFKILLLWLFWRDDEQQHDFFGVDFQCLVNLLDHLQKDALSETKKRPAASRISLF